VPQPSAPPIDLELSTLPGLADVALAELRARFGAGSALQRHPPRLLGAASRQEAIALALPRPSLQALHELRTVSAVQRVLRYPVPRPKALLGDALLRRVRADLAAIVAGAPTPFHALRLEAAGRDSDVMQRLAQALAAGVGLPVDPEAGDLVVRVRPDGEGWALLIRTTPRPLSARPWRVCDRPGGLNAALAAALVRLAIPAAGGRAVNPFAGSGTLAIELALVDARARVEGFDLDPAAVACAERNAAAAGVAARATFAVGDATRWPHADASVAFVLADPPWGDAVGARSRNRSLYPAFLAEAARVLTPGGRLGWVTHEVDLARSVVDPRLWRLRHERRVWHGGHHPLVQVLERRAT
jgi:tRNA (guanine6-N2)-methyltransferase